MNTVTEFSEVKIDRKYRRRTVDEKCQIVEETLSSGSLVEEIARSHELNANQLFDWRKQLPHASSNEINKTVHIGFGIEQAE